METETTQGIGAMLAEMRKSWIEAGIAVAGQESQPVEVDTQAIMRANRMERFRVLCPREFQRNIDRAKIPNLQAWDEADKWTGHHPGLWIWSPETGRAKTRMLWRMFGRLHVNEGRRILKISGQGLADECYEYFRDGEPTAFYKWVCSHSVVMLDDLDKMDFSDARAVRMLRELFDRFYSDHVAVLVTANESRDAMQRRLGQSGARRVNEVCATEVRF